MNAIAAEPGWRNLAIWAMPPVAYALASDTLTASSAPGPSPATTTSTPPWPPTRPPRWPSSAACSCGCCAWPWPPPPPCPGSAPGCWRSARSPPAVAPGSSGRPPHRTRGNATKTARFLDLVTERHGPLASIPLHRVAGISADLAPQLDLNTGAARTALRKAVLAARNADPR